MTMPPPARVVAAKGDYVLGLKGNQGTLHQAVVDHFLGRWEADFAGDPVGRHQTKSTGHGRRESRAYIQLAAPNDLPVFQAWRGRKSIGVAISETLRVGKARDEVRYYLSSLAVEADAKAFAHAARSHWGVENGCRRTLDVTFREKNLRENMAWLSRFSLPLLKQHPGRQCVAMKRRSCGGATTTSCKSLSDQQVSCRWPWVPMPPLIRKHEPILW